METSVRIDVSELDMALIERIKRLFGKDRSITLTITATDGGTGTKQETKKVYFNRLRKAITNLDRGGAHEMTEAQLDSFFLEKLKG